MPTTSSPVSSPSSRRPSKTARWLMLPTFLVLTFALSWAPVIPTGGEMFPHGPMLAALIALLLFSGRAAARDLLQSMTRWRVGLRWWLLAPAVILIAHVAAVATAWSLDLVDWSTADFTWSVVFAILTPLVLAGGQWEEPGWLGFLLVKLQAGSWAPLVVLAVAATIRALWHLPLLANGHIPWFDLVFVSVALQVILMWIYNATGGSLLLPMLCHLSSNVVMALVRENLATADHSAYWAVYTVAISLVALCVLLGTRGRLGLQPPARSPRPVRRR